VDGLKMLMKLRNGNGYLREGSLFPCRFTAFHFENKTDLNERTCLLRKLVDSKGNRSLLHG